MAQQPIDSPFRDKQRRLSAQHLSEQAFNRSRRWCLNPFCYLNSQQICHHSLVSAMYSHMAWFKENLPHNCLCCGTVRQVVCFPSHKQSMDLGMTILAPWLGMQYYLSSPSTSSHPSSFFCCGTVLQLEHPDKETSYKDIRPISNVYRSYLQTG